jgi:hypothetical protein
VTGISLMHDLNDHSVFHFGASDPIDIPCHLGGCHAA